jgi:hypothetical protein
MALVSIILAVILTWNAAAADWIVAYATGFAQLGIWLTIAGLMPFTFLWFSLKTLNGSDISNHLNRARWSLFLKG